VKQSKDKREADVDELFKLPLTEFIGARKTLATRLKKEGRGDHAERVQALVKPSVSAWAVNQLYWQQRAAFARLLATGEDFRRAQVSRHAGKVADMREALDARRKALSELSTLATKILSDTGHNPTPEMVRRITTTLEAISAYASLPDDLAAGRLTQDVDPPGFDSLASFVPGPAKPVRTKEPVRVIPTRKETAATKAPRKASPKDDTREIEKTRQAKIADAKASLQEARRALAKAQAEARNAEAAQKKTNADAKEKEKLKREAEERFEKASTAAEAAAQHAESMADELAEAAKAVKSAEHTMEAAAKELESLL
jgi:DNA repair exonuclease SbcCD ATPase subunit